MNSAGTVPKAISQAGGVEVVLTRLLFAVLLVLYSPVWSAFDLPSIPFPNGLAKVFPLEPLLGHALPFKVLYAAGLLGFVLHWRPALSMAVVALIALLAGTIVQSQGAIGHGGQVLTVLAFAQWATLLWAKRSGNEAPAHAHRLMMSVAPAIMAYVYVTSAITKLDTSGLDWVSHGHFIAVQVVKSHSSAYYTSLDAGLLERGNAIANWILAHPDLSRLMLAGGLFLELFAFLALLGRGWGLFFAIGLAAFHVAVGLSMQLWFTTHVWLLLLFLGHGVHWSLRALDHLRGGNAIPLAQP